MKKLILACMTASSRSNSNIHILAASTRKFGGRLSDSPIWVLVPTSENEFPKETIDKLSSLDVEIIPYTTDPEVMKFPFTDFVLAAATAESLAKDKSDFLSWIGSDTIVINEPKDLLLDEGNNLGYRPVHHTLVGSIYEEPIDPFWELVYQKCNVSKEKIFPMKTHVDGNILRPYFNAGFLTVRPKKGLLQSWWDQFKKLYRDPSFEQFYEKNRLYSIFIHQAVLAGVILSTLQKEELQELPFSYNYPLHLYEESPGEYRPQSINDLITARFEEIETFEKVPLQDPLKSGIIEKLGRS
ncbi:MAG: hypothetical protein ACFFDT_17775 [Candidatus Hodarchaeota archaeon]